MDRLEFEARNRVIGELKQRLDSWFPQFQIMVENTAIKKHPFDFLWRGYRVNSAKTIMANHLSEVYGINPPLPPSIIDKRDELEKAIIARSSTIPTEIARHAALLNRVDSFLLQSGKHPTKKRVVDNPKFATDYNDTALLSQLEELFNKNNVAETLVLFANNYGANEVGLASSLLSQLSIDPDSDSPRVVDITNIFFALAWAVQFSREIEDNNPFTLPLERIMSHIESILEKSPDSTWKKVISKKIETLHNSASISR